MKQCIYSTILITIWGEPSSLWKWKTWLHFKRFLNACLLTDVVIANPIKQDPVAITAVDVGIAASGAPKAREDHYASCSPSDNFIQLAIEVFGCMHHDFDGLLQHTVRAIHSRDSSMSVLISIFTVHFCQQILVTLQCTQAKAIQRRSVAVCITHQQ